MQPLDEKAGKETKQGVNHQPHRTNFTLIGNIVPVGTEMGKKKKKHTMLNTRTLIHTYQSRPLIASKAQILTDLHRTTPISTRRGSLF